MPDIKVIEGFINPDDCKLAIDLINNSVLIPFPDNPTAGTAQKTPEVIEFIKKYSDKSINIHKLWNNLEHPIYTFEAFLTVWKINSYAGVHIDNHENAEFVQHSSVLYFNDEFEGGEIYFPEFDFVHTPKAGDGIFFPAFTEESKYEHGVTKITKGNRYTMGLWHTQSKEFADKELL